MIILKKNFRTYDIDYDIYIIENILTIRIDDKTEQFDLSALQLNEEYTLTDCLILPYSPIKRIYGEKNDLVADLFFDDWYKTTPQEFERKGIVFTPKPTKDNNLDLAKEAQVPVITSAFDKEIETGHFMSTILGIEVDCRRSITKNDKQNVEGLISNMTRNSKTSINYVGYSEIKTGVTKEQLETLVAEMEDHVLALYEKKWVLQSEIENASTIDEVKNINW